MLAKLIAVIILQHIHISDRCAVCLVQWHMAIISQQNWIQKIYVHISWGIYKHAQQKRICIFYEKQELPRGKSQTKRILKACLSHNTN